MIRQFLNFLKFAALCALPHEARSDTAYTAPFLSSVGAFYSGGAPRKMDRLEALSPGQIRDGLRWRDVEQQKGQYSFDAISAASLSTLHSRRLLGPVMLLPQTPLYNDAQTVTGPEDIRAFARYVQAVAQHFPDVPIEIANEFNGGAFVSGTARNTRPAARAALHASMLAEIANTGMPRDRIIGGALHSMSGGYLWALLDAGAAAHMGSVAIHPYTTAPEALPRQMAFLRRHPKMANVHVDVTEFGTKDLPKAADFFWRFYCQMALSDVRSAFWYPLDLRKDGYAPVLDRKLDLTPVGKAITFAAIRLAGRSVEPVRPDPFTYGCLFAGKVLVLWGAERRVILQRPDLMVFRSDGNRLTGPAHLAQDTVTVIRVPAGAAPIDLKQDVAWGPQTVLFDSFDQFTYPDAAGDPASLPYLTHQGSRRPFVVCPGQDRPEAPWYPHLCLPDMPRAVLHDRGFVLPHRDVQFYTGFEMPRSTEILVTIPITVHPRSEDGVEVILRIDGTEHARTQVRGNEDVVFGPMHAAKGAQIEFVLDPGASSIGDQGRFRVRVRQMLTR